MVFESLIKAENAEKRPMLVFLLGALYSSLAVLFGLWIFKRDIGIFVVSIIVFASIPLMYKVIILEEKKDKRIQKESKLLMEHRKALTSFVALFFGIMISLSLWYVFLPSDVAKETFSSQIREVNIVEQEFSGNVVKPGDFLKVFLNNFKVLFFSFVFSFFFGAGAIFILTWNASLIAVAIGSLVRENLSSLAGSNGLVMLAAYFGTFSYGILGYMTHGIFEIASYFIAGLAGGIVSVAVIKHDFFNKKYKRIVKDALFLMGISVVVLLFAAFVESYLSSLFF